VPTAFTGCAVAVAFAGVIQFSLVVDELRDVRPGKDIDEKDI
jgi:hypothetical protein